MARFHIFTDGKAIVTNSLMLVIHLICLFRKVLNYWSGPLMCTKVIRWGKMERDLYIKQKPFPAFTFLKGNFSLKE